LLNVGSSARAAGANDRIRFGVIGCGGMGTGHLSNLVKRGGNDNIQVLAVCDVYPSPKETDHGAPRSLPESP
jgi:predicted dehydrogenase